MTCPECGGEMAPAGRGKKTCQSCGLTLGHMEYERMWDKLRTEKVSRDDKKKRDQKEYLAWLQSDKKDK
jgi:tRNA(Ile2) C34 agmatinyltransferase TiaS